MNENEDNMATESPLFEDNKPNDTAGDAIVLPSKEKKGSALPLLVYGGFSTLFILAILAVVFFSPSARVIHTVAEGSERTGLLWDGEAPQSVSKTWEQAGYKTLSDAPGAVIAATEDSVVRIDERDGSTIWEYKRPGGSVCDMKQAWGETVVIFDMGKGCSEIMKLNSETGQYSRQASYATDQDIARLVFGGDGRLGIVTPNSVRIVRDDLVTTAQYGDDVDPVNPVDNTYKNCTIFDVGIGPNDFVVSSQCEGDKGNTFIRAFGIDPDEPRELVSTVEVNTGSQDPVSITAVSLAQMQFIIPDSSPRIYTWQLDKDKRELAARDLKPGEYATGFWDYPGIGYLWGVGETLHVRFGSEDISQSKQKTGVIGNPLTADQQVIAPQRDGFLLWDTRDDAEHLITTDQKLEGRKYAFAGDTFVELREDKLIAYS